MCGSVPSRLSDLEEDESSVTQKLESLLQESVMRCIISEVPTDHYLSVSAECREQNDRLNSDLTKNDKI